MEDSRRPYPDGIGFDEAWFQRQRADAAERAIRRLAEQDATLSVCDGNVTVTLDATLTDAEREAIENCIYASVRIGDDWSDKQAATLRGLLERLA